MTRHLAFFLVSALCLSCAAPLHAQDFTAQDQARLDALSSHLRQGSRGPAVAALQRGLSDLGIPLSDDGVFGPMTAGGVRLFQRRSGLQADGIVGPLTLAALRRALGTPSSGTPASSGGSSGGTATTPSPAPSTGGGGIIPALGGSGSATGSSIFSAARSLGGSSREAHFLREVQRGNTPRFLDRFVKITLRGRDANGRDHVLELWVAPDYLSVGTDADYVRVPLMPSTAQRICDQRQCLLPTRKVVDAIYAQASVKLSPQPLPPGPAMTTTPYFQRHDDRVRDQLNGRQPGALVAGHKKDVVISPRLQTRRGRVAIYGWHQRNGRPIQPLTTVHGATYVDYSHGIRLVRDAATLDGHPASASAILRDAVLHPLLSDEGRFSSTRAD